MELKDALEIILTMAEDNALVPRDIPPAEPAIVEAAQAQQEALSMLRYLTNTCTLELSIISNFIGNKYKPAT